MVRTLLSLLKAWVRSLVRKLRSPKAMHSEAKKKGKRKMFYRKISNAMERC